MNAVPATPKPRNDQAVRVMVVDDSVVIRGLISRWLDALPDIEVAVTCRNGEDAVKKIADADVDIVILDIEMPVMDGMTALPKLLQAAPGVRVLMASTLTRRNADISLKALKLGAADYVPKPESTREGNAPEEFQRELVAKIRGLGRRRRPAMRAGSATSPAAQPGARRPLSPAPAAAPKPIVLQPASKTRPRIVAIGSSTGGPRALFDLLGALSPSLERLPVVITQHMPATFTSILAEHIEGVAKRPCVEGQVNFCRPSVDPMLDSLIAIYGPAILTCILTGMGHDGRDSARRVQQGGGTVIAQDEETSVVWGMPGAVAQAGICHKVLPLGQLAETMARLIVGGVS